MIAAAITNITSQLERKLDILVSHEFTEQMCAKAKRALETELVRFGHMFRTAENADKCT